MSKIKTEIEELKDLIFSNRGSLTKSGLTTHEKTKCNTQNDMARRQIKFLESLDLSGYVKKSEVEEFIDKNAINHFRNGTEMKIILVPTLEKYFGLNNKE